MPFREILHGGSTQLKLFFTFIIKVIFPRSIFALCFAIIRFKALCQDVKLPGHTISFNLVLTFFHGEGFSSGSFYLKLMYIVKKLFLEL